MAEPIVTALTTAMDASAKAVSSPGPMAFADRLFGFKLSEWIAQGEVIRQQINDEYKDAREKGLGMQYANAIREKTNVLNTLAKATVYIKEGFKREIDIGEDVFWNLLDHSKTISNDDVQDVIARIIAGEYNNPGTYSMSTLQTLKSLGKAELDLLGKVGCLLVNNDQVPRAVFQSSENYKQFLSKIGITYPQFQLLQSLGLFYGNDATRNIENIEKNKVNVTYFDKVLVFKLVGEEAKVISVPSFYSMTPVGRQILSHLDTSINNEYYEWLKLNYKINHYALEV